MNERYIYIYICDRGARAAIRWFDFTLARISSRRSDSGKVLSVGVGFVLFELGVCGRKCGVLSEMWFLSLIWGA